ncbi:MAG: hypothetical protein QF473_01595 [Planctomycetota bacterium]|jgi:hypothetical protein|nr:hypothetical protein [Planctomycetota bacterium]
MTSSLLLLALVAGSSVSIGDGTRKDARPLQIKFKPESLKGMKYQAYTNGEMVFSLNAETARFSRRKIGFISINVRDQLRMTAVGLKTSSGKEIKAGVGTLSLSTGRLTLKTSKGAGSIHLKQLLKKARESREKAGR